MHPNRSVSARPCSVACGERQRKRDRRRCDRCTRCGEASSPVAVDSVGADRGGRRRPSCRAQRWPPWSSPNRRHPSRVSTTTIPTTAATTTTADDRAPSTQLPVAIGPRRAGWLHRGYPLRSGALTRHFVVPQVALYHVGMGQHLSRGTDGDDLALIERDQPIGDRRDQRQVVFDHQQAGAHLVAQSQQHRRQRLDLALGDATGRLVEQHHGRAMGDQAGKIDDATSARRQLADERVAIRAEVHHLDQFVDAHRWCAPRRRTPSGAAAPRRARCVAWSSAPTQPPSPRSPSCRGTAARPGSCGRAHGEPAPSPTSLLISRPSSTTRPPSAAT